MQNSKEILIKNFKEVFLLPESAIEWLVMLWDAIQFFDDIADNDETTREDLNSTIWNTLVAVHNNYFFLQNSSVLVPCVATMILKWQASDKAERNKQADEKSFMWRAGYYDVVLMVLNLVHGTKVATENADLVMKLYGETLEDYKKEFNNA